MFRIVFFGLVVLGMAGTAAMVCAQATAPTTSPEATSDEEEAVRQVRERFVRAFNAGETETLAALFFEGAELFDDAGNRHQGRDAIVEAFTRFFEVFPGANSEMNSRSAWLIGPGLAIDQGQRLVTARDGKASAATRYTLVLLKKEGQWKIASGREVNDDVSLGPRDRLMPLAWLVGDWVDEGADAVIEIACRWSEDKNFLLAEFTARIEGKPALKSSQRIGWDPLTRKIRSWVFDSDGGYGEGVWTRVENRWVIKSSAVLPDGQTGSATLMLEPRDKDSYLMTGFDRFRGEKAEPDFAVTIVRKPPEPVSGVGSGSANRSDRNEARADHVTGKENP